MTVSLEKYRVNTCCCCLLILLGFIGTCCANVPTSRPFNFKEFFIYLMSQRGRGTFLGKTKAHCCWDIEAEIISVGAAREISY